MTYRHLPYDVVKYKPWQQKCCENTQPDEGTQNYRKGAGQRIIESGMNDGNTQGHIRRQRSYGWQFGAWNAKHPTLPKGAGQIPDRSP